MYIFILFSYFVYSIIRNNKIYTFFIFRAKYHKLKYGTEIPQSEMQLPSASSSAQDEYSSIPEVGADSEAPLSSVSNVSWKQGRQLLRE